MTIKFPLRIRFAIFGLDHHFGNFFQPFAARIAKPKDLFGLYEPQQQLDEIVGEWGISHPEFHLKCVLGQRRKQSTQLVFARDDCNHFRFSKLN